MNAGDVMRAARGWIGTRWMHQGRLRGVGVDCIGLLLGVARELQLLDARSLAAIEAQASGYGRQPDGRLQPMCRAHLLVVPLCLLRPGDVILVRFDTLPQHLAIVGEDQGGRRTLIHAYAHARRVVEHGMDERWLARVVEAYRFPALAYET